MTVQFANTPIRIAPSIELFSPIPPLQTGTASYFSAVLDYISSIIGARADVIIAVDPVSFDNVDDMPREFLGFPVVDYQSLQEVPSPGTTRVYFLANNAYHAYIHRLIFNSNSLAQGKIITIVHDASVFMLSRYMFGDPNEAFDVESLETIMMSQFGDYAARVFTERLDDRLPMNVEYEIHCLGPTLESSHEVWVHSLFALSKLLLENSIATARLPQLRLAAHPLMKVNPPSNPHSGNGRFVIGMFGWVTEPKRIDAILHGLALALQWLPADSEERMLLRVVGRKPQDWDYHPDRLAQALGIGKIVEFIDYPNRDEFERLQFECHLTLNLRYPSTGETSGTFATAQMAGTPVVTSRYHAFHEIGVPGATVTSVPVMETWSIAETIMVGFQRWLSGKSAGPSPRKHSPVTPVEKLLLREIAESLELGSSKDISR